MSVSFETCLENQKIRLRNKTPIKRTSYDPSYSQKIKKLHEFYPIFRIFKWYFYIFLNLFDRFVNFHFLRQNPQLHKWKDILIVAYL